MLVDTRVFTWRWLCFNVVDKCTIDFMVQLQVRLQSKGGRHSSVVFCTNGILLRVLVGKGSVSYISDITHIIVVLDIFLFDLLSFAHKYSYICRVSPNNLIAWENNYETVNCQFVTLSCILAFLLWFIIPDSLLYPLAVNLILWLSIVISALNVTL